MQYVMPDYYNEFRCAASACSDTCCAGWQIMIDEESLEKYKKVEGGFGNRLQNSIHWKQQCFDQYQKRCAFLNEENLCDIYQECGEDYLCQTCKTYPRHVEEFEDLREQSLALSCPVAAELILDTGRKVEFLTKEDDLEDEEYEEFDYFLFTSLMDARTVMLKLLQDRGINYRVRTAMVLSLAHDIQVRINQGRLFELDVLLERYTKPDAVEKFAKKLIPYTDQKRRAAVYAKEMFSIFPKMEVLNEKWIDQVSHAQEVLFAQKKEKAKRPDQGLYWEKLMVYFVFTYFSGAVYDEDACSKMKLAVASTMLIMEMDKVYDDVLEVARAFSREIEHSDQNLECFEEQMYKNEIFSVERLMYTIMNR